MTVVVDTEEEFDWGKPHSRSNTEVAAMQYIQRAQAVFDVFRVNPCYVVDYPVVAREAGFGPLKAIHDDGRCSIGAHLHPWVNPPHEEEVNSQNSYPGNLPKSLERRKLEVLNDRIHTVFGHPASVYKAGRFGVGLNSAAILEELGFEVDVSPLAAFNFTADGGPNFEHISKDPWWFGDQRRLLCIPGTAALVGVLGSGALPCYRLATHPLLERLRVPGILARLRVVDRLRLSPEGYSLDEMRRLTRFLFARDVRVFSLSFHSPSVVPGCTPYVKSKGDLDDFLSRLQSYFEFFFDELGGRTMSPLEVRDYYINKTS